MINNPKILVIEDNAINLRVITLLLQDLGYDNLISASTGREGLKRFTKSVKLVMLDIGLPDISGVEVAKQLRQKSKIPIIAYTAFDANLEWFDYGVTDCLIKPITTERLNQIMQKYLPISI